MKTATTMKTLKGFSYSVIATLAFIFSFNTQTFASRGEADSTVISIDKRNQTLLNQKNNKTLRENLQELFKRKNSELKPEHLHEKQKSAARRLLFLVHDHRSMFVIITHLLMLLNRVFPCTP